jgi:putative ABC transport system permease protein
VRPPRLAVRLLEAALPPAWRDEALGDLHEEHASRARASRRRAALWYWGEALQLAARARLRSRASGPAFAGPPRRSFMEETLANLRFALRGLRRHPGIAALAILTLAVGLAANAAIFSTLDALLLRPLALKDVDRLVRVWETSADTDDYDRATIARGSLADWRDGARGVLDELVGLEWWDANLQAGELPERVQGYLVSPAFFDVVGAAPALGRGFLAEDSAASQRHAVVIGHDLWQRRFGADPAVLGRQITVDGESFAIVGVAPPGFRFPDGAELWAPLVIDAGAARDERSLTGIGRLRAGHTPAEAAARLDVVAQRLRREHPDTNASWGVRVVDLTRGFEDSGLRPILAVWQASALLVLLIACVNVSNLMLARGEERRAELAVRVALGAGRGRVVRQLVTEGLLLATVAAALSLPLTALATREIRRHLPADLIRFIPGWRGIDVDARTLLFAGLLAALAAMVFSLWPALRAARPDLVSSLREGGRGGSVDSRRQLGRSVLVVLEVACALALLVGAGVAVRGAVRLLDGPQGYDPDRLLTLELALPEKRYGSEAARRAFVRELDQRLAELPGVAAVAAANVLPARGSNSSRYVVPEGEVPADPSRLPSADARTVSPGYFAALGIPLLAGRGLTAEDDETAPAVAVVSQSMARRFWPGADPIGRRFRVGGVDGPLVSVVGVCGDVIHHWFARRDYPTFYRPYAQSPGAYLAFALRTRGEPEAFALAARRAVTAVDPNQPAADVISMRYALYRTTIGVQYGAGIMAVFGIVALVLAVSGVYAVMAYRIGLRESEFGVRVAMGASPRQVLGIALGQAGRLTLAGLGIGFLLAFALARAMNAAFQGVMAPDALSFAALGLVLLVTAMVAALIPARRALRADPMRLLRSG